MHLSICSPPAATPTSLVTYVTMCSSRLPIIAAANCDDSNEPILSSIPAKASSSQPGFCRNSLTTCDAAALCAATYGNNLAAYVSSSFFVGTLACDDPLRSLTANSFHVVEAMALFPSSPANSCICGTCTTAPPCIASASALNSEATPYGTPNKFANSPADCPLIPLKLRRE